MDGGLKAATPSDEAQDEEQGAVPEGLTVRRSAAGETQQGEDSREALRVAPRLPRRAAGAELPSPLPTS